MSPHDGMVNPDDLYLADILDWNLIANPGVPFWGWGQYSFGATHVLSVIVNRSTGQYTSDFAQEYLFVSLGISEDDRYWLIDEDDIAVGGSALCMKPRDIAKIGYLCLNNGTWDGAQILTEEYLINATNDYPGAMPYEYQFWLGTNYYYASGAYGQSIYVIPESNMVVIFTFYSRYWFSIDSLWQYNK